MSISKSVLVHSLQLIVAVAALNYSKIQLSTPAIREVYTKFFTLFIVFEENQVYWDKIDPLDTKFTSIIPANGDAFFSE